MRYEIVLAPEAAEDLQGLNANAQVLDGMERHLRYEPTKSSKSRIKRLRKLSHPQYRLRVADDVRIFYDVTGDLVQVLAIVPKSDAARWLERHGESDEESSPDSTQG